MPIKIGTGSSAVDLSNLKVAGVEPTRIMVGTGSAAVEVWSAGLPVVTITGTSGYTSRDQFRAACTAYGTTYQTVTTLPFRLDTSQATNVSYMFDGCSSLTQVAEMDTSQVTNMQSMFYNCSALTQVPELNTSQVTNMNRMFYNCSSLTSVPELNTSQVTLMTYMFYGCSSLTGAPDLSTPQATDLSYMFYGCSSLTSVPGWDTSKVINMASMFRDCSSLTTAPDLNTSQATNMDSMFEGCSSLTQVPDLDTSQVTIMGYMFWGCTSLTDGNVRLIGRRSNVTIFNMILNSGLTREPFQGAEGTITGRTLTNNTLTTLATHTITAAEGANLKLLRMTLAWGNATATKSIRIDRNGVQVATATGQNPVATVEVVCNVGDTITYGATVNSTTTANRVINSGTWGAWTR